MRIANMRALPGPNIHFSRPVLRCEVDLEEMAEARSRDFPGLGDRLLTALPELRQASFEEGSVPGPGIAPVILVLHQRAGLAITFARALTAEEPGQMVLLVEYQNEPAARHLAQTALELIDTLARGNTYPVEEKLQEARRLFAATELGPSTRAIVDAAARRGIPWVRLNEGSLVQLGHGIHRKLIQATETSCTSSVSVDIAGDKDLTKKLLSAAFLPVPQGVVVRSRAEAVAALNSLSPPLAVKPLDGNQGRGVSLGLRTAEEVAAAFDVATALSAQVVVEEFFTGRDYRVVVVHGKMVATSERTPAHVLGDGTHTIAELVAIENRNPLRGEGHEKPLTQLRLDSETDAFLQRQGKQRSDVPARGEQVLLRQTANLSTGGTAHDVTDHVHPEVVSLCERAARLIGLDVCGIDLILPDISQPMPEAGGAGILEVNAAPGIRMHHHPSAGPARDVGSAIVDMLYPPGTEARIPIVAITGTNGKTTVTRMIGHALESTGQVVGMTTTDGITIGGRVVATGDLTGFQSARTVLGDPLVEAAVLETARGGIVRRSLGFDWADVGVLTNIQPDHLGQDGINSLEDILFVKALVAERVRAGGTLVLNAEDERLARLPDHPRLRPVPRRIVYFALTADSPVVQAHVRAGGIAYYLQDDYLIEAVGLEEQRIAHVAEVPVALGGTARFQIANALAASAACRALGLSREEMALALRTFGKAGENPGRMNLYQVKRGYVIADFGHNPGAFAAFCEMAKAWADRRRTVIFTMPGDRPDALVEEVARLVARHFDRIILREDEDLRGRPPGAMTTLLRRLIAAEAPDKECRFVPEEAAALRVALEDMEEDEVIALFFEKNTEPVLYVLRSFGGQPVTALASAQVAPSV